MSESLMGVLRGIVRDELARLQPPEIGVVTRVFPREQDDDVSNHQINVRLRSSGIELQRVPVTVQRLGLSALPAEGDLVLIAFVGHDLNAPVAVGCLYDDQAHPPVAKVHEVIYQPPGDEDAGTRRLHIELANGSSLTLADDRLEIAFGDTKVFVKRDGDVEIQAAGGVYISAGGDLQLAAGGKISLDAKSDLTMKAGTQAAVEAASQLKLKGAQVGLAGITEFSPS